MNEGIKVTRKIAAVFLSLLLGFECFGAAVSDNNGAAFITKAEFDSLKSTFQDQINRYNQSIDNKIDTAIASYLAGIKDDKKVSYKIIPNDLTNGAYVNFMNGYIIPEFRLPNFYYDLVTYIWFDKKTDIERYYTIFGNYRIQYSKTWETDETNRKPLVKLLSGSEGGSSNIYYWDGIAYRYNEEILSTNLKYVRSASFAGNIDVGNISHYLNLQNPFTYDQYSGARIIDQNLLTNTSIKYSNSNGYSLVINSWDSQKSIMKLAIKLDDYNGTKKDHIVISQYDGSTAWDCYNEEFVNYLKTSSFQSKTSKNLFDIVKSSIYKTEYAMLFSTNREYAKDYWTDKTVTWKVSDSDTHLPSAGFVGSLFARNLRLFKSRLTKSFRNKDWYIEPSTLEQGVPTLAAKKGDKVTWDVNFDHVYCYNAAPSSGDLSDNQNEVDLYFSYEPFVNGVTTGSTALDDENLVKFRDGAVEKKFFTTKERKGKVEFEMKKDSVVYVKAVPHWDTSAAYNGINDWWNLYLNINGDNGTFTVEYE